MDLRPIAEIEIAVPCAHCGAKTSQSIGWLKARDHIDCAACGQSFGLDKSQFDEGVRAAEQAQQAVRDTMARVRSAFGKKP